jgi:hypothetical protein
MSLEFANDALSFEALLHSNKFIFIYMLSVTYLKDLKLPLKKPSLNFLDAPPVLQAFGGQSRDSGLTALSALVHVAGPSWQRRPPSSEHFATTW